MHIALYREFRPDTFDQLIGQDHIVRILKNQIKTGNTSHAYLFSGTRGTGKTTTARILARALNCSGQGEKPCGQCEHCRSFAEGSFVDVIEMDAASHRGVNDIHEITDSVMYAPAAGNYKVYIIDEVHMLSNEAFNALLKTLEEPPEHVVFILATTEPQKVPATILSRCMKLDFRRVSEKLLVENMNRICEQKQIEAEPGALSLIAVSADGSVRDSLSILEQCICPGEPLRRDDVASVLGTAGTEPLLRLTERVLDQDPSGALLCLNDVLSAGSETKQFMKEWLEHFRNLLIAKYVKDPANILNMSTENAERVVAQSARMTQTTLERAIRELTETISLTKWAKHPRVMLEMAIVKLSSPVAGHTPAAPQPAPAQEQQTRRAEAPAAFPADSEPVPEAPGLMVPPPDKKAKPQEAPSAPPSASRQDTILPEQPLSSSTHYESEGQNGPAAGSQFPPFSEEDWRQVIDQAASAKGLLTRLIGRTHFREERDGQLYIACDDATTADLLRNRGREMVEQILRQTTGRPLKITVEAAHHAPQTARNGLTEEQQAQLNQFFERDVPVRQAEKD